MLCENLKQQKMHNSYFPWTYSSWANIAIEFVIWILKFLYASISILPQRDP